MTDSIMSPDSASVAEVENSAPASCAVRVERDLSRHRDRPAVSVNFLTSRAGVEPGDGPIEEASPQAPVHRIGYRISESTGSRAERDPGE